MRYDLNVERAGNALSILASYSLESMMVSMQLRDKKTGNTIAIEDIESLEDIQSTTEEISFDNDMVSFIEIASIEAGSYELQIIIMKSLFLPT
jgi:hypothetical protein